MNKSSDRRSLRVGAVSYLNTKPLVFGLDEHVSDMDLIFDLPSRLADDLTASRLDVALIPSVEYFQHADFRIVSDACIGCRGPVRSVVLLGRRPLSEIQTLALDEGSRTSVALSRILLQQRFGIAPQLVPFPIGSAIDDIEADAVLVIGDRAMSIDKDVYSEVWDLGEEWCRWAELPFVFAMWVARPGIDVSDLDRILRQARDAGVANLEQIAAQEHAKVGLKSSECLRYLRDHLHFRLGDRERRGLDLFRQHEARLEMVESSL